LSSNQKMSRAYQFALLNSCKPSVGDEHRKERQDLGHDRKSEGEEFSGTVEEHLLLSKRLDLLGDLSLQT
jgi:hypothetical protein